MADMRNPCSQQAWNKPPLHFDGHYHWAGLQPARSRADDLAAAQAWTPDQCPTSRRLFDEARGSVGSSLPIHPTVAAPPAAAAAATLLTGGAVVAVPTRWAKSEQMVR